MIKNIVLIISFSFLTGSELDAQQIDSVSQCNVFEKTNISAFIVGNSGNSINSKFVIDSINLKLSDTLYRVLRYRLSFDDRDNILVLASQGPTLKETTDSKVSLKKIREAPFIAIDYIVATKDGKCFKIPSIFYKIEN